MGKIRSNFMFGVRTPWTLTVGGLLLAIVIWSCVYSYLVWRNDPKAQHA